MAWAQGVGGSISVTMMAQNHLLRVGILSAADVNVELEPEAAERVLDELNNRDEANINVSFR